jgi:hypothetical protein
MENPVDNSDNRYGAIGRENSRLMRETYYTELERVMTGLTIQVTQQINNIGCSPGCPPSEK